MNLEDKVWMIYVQIGRRWVALRNSDVFTSRNKCLAAIKKEGMTRDFYRPQLVAVPMYPRD
jgi:hypothetical protein